MEVLKMSKELEYGTEEYIRKQQEVSYFKKLEIEFEEAQDE